MLVCLLLTTGFVLLTSKLILVEDEEAYDDFSAGAVENSYQSEDFYETEATTAARTTKTFKVDIFRFFFVYFCGVVY